MTRREFYERVVERPQFEIVIANQVFTDDVAAVEIELWVGGAEYWTAKGTARRDLHDPKNPEIAIKLALGRAIRQLGRDVLSEGQELVRQADRASKKQAAVAAELKAKRDKAAKKKKK